VPFSIVLFAGGVVLAYWAAPFAIQWFCGYIKVLGGTTLNQDPQHFVIFMVKLLAAFGAVFQLPIVLMFLAWVGILTADGMKRSWRHAVVGISFVGLMVTPSNDPFTMLMMIIPVIILYLGSISLVAIVERNRNKRMGGA
jgi:sec-independent protein translocase protein TatC